MPRASKQDLAEKLYAAISEHAYLTQEAAKAPKNKKRERERIASVYALEDALREFGDAVGVEFPGS